MTPGPLAINTSTFVGANRRHSRRRGNHLGYIIPAWRQQLLPFLQRHKNPLMFPGCWKG
ncbi:MAG: hypothetical protein ACLT8E_07005 [Akkermansia sp.]